jgi:thioredoxin reductase (NADPH)
VTSHFRPTRAEVVNYYQRVAAHFRLRIQSYEGVEAISRVDGRFQLTTSKGRSLGAKNVVFATGYYDNPTRLGVAGEELPKVFHHFREPHPYFGCDVAVIGGKNSAVETALALHRQGARVTLIHRGKSLSRGVKYWILPDIENRIAEGSIQAFFGSRVKEIRDDSILFTEGRGRTRKIKNDFVFIQIGYQPRVRSLIQLGVKVNARSLVPKHNVRTMETNVRGVYLAGSIAAGRENNKIFIENGRLHGALIVRSILSRR